MYDFEFDRAAFDIKQETVSAMNYDRIVRLYGDPAQISNFASAFHHLQLSSGSSLFFKATLNLLSLYKWRKIIVTLVHCIAALTTYSHRPLATPVPRSPSWHRHHRRKRQSRILQATARGPCASLEPCSSS